MTTETVDSNQRCTVCGELPCDNPHKRFTVIFKVEAHSWEDAAKYIQEFADHVVEHGSGCQLVSSNRGWIKVTERPEQTEEKYDAELERWFQERKKPAPNRCTCGDDFVAVTGAHDAACPVVRISDGSGEQK